MNFSGTYQEKHSKSFFSKFVMTDDNSSGW